MTGIQGNHGRLGPSKGHGMDRCLVAVRYGGHRIGLYQVKQVGEAGMLLNHGGISFPVGTRLDVEEDLQPIAPDAIPSLRSATVVGNTPSGLRLAWCHVDAGKVR